MDEISASLQMKQQCPMAQGLHSLPFTTWLVRILKMNK